jgi:hypothetical protein
MESALPLRREKKQHPYMTMIKRLSVVAVTVILAAARGMISFG